MASHIEIGIMFNEKLDTHQLRKMAVLIKRLLSLKCNIKVILFGRGGDDSIIDHQQGFTINDFEALVHDLYPNFGVRGIVELLELHSPATEGDD